MCFNNFEKSNIDKMTVYKLTYKSTPRPKKIETNWRNFWLDVGKWNTAPDVKRPSNPHLGRLSCFIKKEDALRYAKTWGEDVWECKAKGIDYVGTYTDDDFECCLVTSLKPIERVFKGGPFYDDCYEAW